MFSYSFNLCLNFLLLCMLPINLVGDQNQDPEFEILNELQDESSSTTPLLDYLGIFQFSIQDLNELDSHPFFKNMPNSFSTSHIILTDEQRCKNKELTDHPKWGEGDTDKVNHYYSAHAEGRIDRLLGALGCKMGVILHGDVTQQELASRLNQFDIYQLLQEGPSFHPQFSLAAQQLMYDSLQYPQIFDIHLHNLGYDEGNYLHPKAAAFGIAPWKDYLTFLVLRYAAGMRSPIGSTQEARQRIHLYAAHFPKLHGIILPIHKAILENGTPDWNNTGNFLKNYSALLTATTFSHPEAELLPAVSVHPFDSKWKEKLIKAHAKGIRLVKWMPPQSIPPDSELLDPYYETLSELNMFLIAHAGPEHTIPTTKDNENWKDWGNPLRFRKALKMGVNVILAHCGHRDNIPDLDHPDQPNVEGYQLFLRLAREAYRKNQTGEWKGKLFGDLAAVTTHYGPEFIAKLLRHSNEEGIRLIYGSDYPHTNLIHPLHDAYDECAKAGLINPEKVKPLKEIRKWNPLLANYIFTKNLELTLATGETARFPDHTFTGEFYDVEFKLIDHKQWQSYKTQVTHYDE